MKLPSTHLTKSIKQSQAVLLAIILSLAILLQPLVSPAPVQADDAVKTATAAAPGSTSDVQIRIKNPSSADTEVFVVFALDASYSMGSYFGNAKTAIRDFAYWVYDNGYRDRTTISVVNFSKQPCSSPEDNNYISIPINQVKITTRTQLDSALAGTGQGCNGNIGFTNITAGIAQASNLLPSSGSTNRFLVLLSDGYQNMPRAGSYENTPGDSNYTGTCPLARSGGINIVPSDVSKRWDQFYVVQSPSSANSNILPSVDYPNFAGLAWYQSSCKSYLSATGESGTSITGKTLLDRMAAAYYSGGGNNDTTGSLMTAITKVKNTLVSTFSLNDYLNTNVFSNTSGTITNISVYDCPSTTGGTAIPTSQYSILASGNRIYGAIIYDKNVSYYCIRFRASIKSGAATGTQTVNSSTNTPPSNNCNNAAADDNVIKYQNAAGDTIGCDNITLGTVSISNYDIELYEFKLTNDTSNTAQRVYNLNESIYTSYRLRNTNASGTIPAGAKSTFFKNQSAAVSVGTIGDTGITAAHNNFAAGGSYGPYESRPGGTNNSRYTAPTYSWSQSIAGNYTARAFANYESGSPVTETDYSNNQATVSYSVITQPSNLNRTFTCNSANFTWTAGSSNITGYRLVISSGGSPVQTLNVVGNLASTSTTGLSSGTNYTWTLQANTANGYSNTLNNGSSFTTSTCQSFNTTVPGGTIIQPGGSIANQSVNLNFLPSTSAWGSNTVTIKVVAVLAGTNNCSAYTPASAAVTAGSGGASGITINMPPYPGGRIGSANRTATDGNPFAINLQASAATANGTYTICVASSSASGTANNPMVAQTFQVANPGWLQIDANSVSRNAGDVHSNGNIAFTIPTSQYFFKTVAGLVSATSGTAQGLAIDNSRLAATVQWRVAAYSPTITSPAYDSLLKTVTEKLKAAPTTITASTANSTTHMTNNCSTAGPKAYLINGDLVRAINTTLTNANCANTQIIYFINGNLTLNSYINDTTDNSGIVFIVNGNITVGSSVARIDAALLFNGSFTTSAGTNALVINGSVIGLAGQSPSATSGNFLSGSQSGFLRDLGSGNNNPAETISYQPKYLDILKTPLGSSTFSWVE